MSRPDAHLAPPVLPERIAQHLPFDRFLVDTGAWRMHVMRTGTGPDVVCLHGNPTWGYLYRKVALRLQDRFCVTMPDLIGLGLSDKPADATLHTIPNHATWLARGLQLAGTGAFVLVVQDWGGPFGLAMAAQLRERLAGLVVLNTVLGPPDAAFSNSAFNRFARLPVVADAVFRGAGFPQNVMRRVQHDPSTIDSDAAFAYRWPLRDVRHNQAPLALARLVPDGPTHPSNIDLQHVADTIAGLQKLPTAIVWGARDPMLGRTLPRIEQQLPHARVWRTQGGHFLPEEEPAAIAEAITWVAQQAGMRF